jgi:hypothetical protein
MSELLFGTTGVDSLEITSTGTLVFAGGGADEVLGKTTANPSGSSIYGGSGNDVIEVENGDRVFAGNGNDIIKNLSGENNQLFGGAGDDEIYGGKNDILVGGSGADEFWFDERVRNVTGFDNTIVDFSKGENDKIVLYLTGIHSLDDLAPLDTTTSTGDTLVKLKDGTVLTTVKGVTDLTGTDFVFAKDIDGAPSGFDGAVDLETISNATKNQLGSFSTIDLADMYKFNLTEESNVTIDLTSMAASGNGDLFLIKDDGDGVFLGVSQKDGNADEQITVDALASGEYYIQITQIEGSTSYNLSVKAEFAGINDGAPSGFEGAVDLETISNETKSKPGSFSFKDTADMYKFNLANQSDVTIDLTGMAASGNGDLFLIKDDGDGVFLGVSQEDGNSDEQITVGGLASGEYYIQITKVDGFSNYNLSVKAEDNSDDSAGSDYGAATPFGTLTSSITQFGSFAIGLDTADVYSFSVANNTIVDVTLSGMSADNYAQLFLAKDTNNDGFFEESEVLFDDQNEDGSDQIINDALLSGGEYFILITQVVGTSNYTLNLAIA